MTYLLLATMLLGSDMEFGAPFILNYNGIETDIVHIEFCNFCSPQVLYVVTDDIFSNGFEDE